MSWSAPSLRNLPAAPVEHDTADAGALPELHAASPADAAALALAGSATFLEAFAGILDGLHIVEHCGKQHAVEKYTAWLADPQYAICKVELKGAIVGYAVLSPPAELPVALQAGDVELKRIYLLARYQGKGLGRAMMDWAKEQARARDAQRLLLGVYANNARAIDFYQRAGFSQLGTRTFHIGQGVYQDFVLALPIN
jgi:ribosomal protein S18 acetylase RimI-like enzyme